MRNPFLNYNEGRIRTGWRLIGQFFLMFLVGLLLLSALEFIFSLNGSLAYSVAMLLGALFSTWAAARGLDKRVWSEFGVTINKKWLVESLIGFVVAAAAIAVIFIIEYWAGWLSIVGYGHQLVESGRFIWTFAGYFLFMACIGFYEELVFRGYQITNLAEGLNFLNVSRKQSAIYAVVMTSVVFGVLHLRNPNADWFSTLNITLAGLMLAFPYLITGRLSYSIGLHFGWNFFQGGVFGFAVSGLRYQKSLIKIEQVGPQLLTGGVFGPEAGLLGLVAMILVGAAFIAIFKAGKQLIRVNERFGRYKKSEQ